MVSVCEGSQGQLEESRQSFKEVLQLIRRKNNQIEQFVMKRVRILRHEGPRLHLVCVL